MNNEKLPKACLTLYSIFLTLLTGFGSFLYLHNIELSKQNEKLKMINSRTDKMHFKQKSSTKEEFPLILYAAKKYNINPDFLFALRHTENGVLYYEFGYNKIPDHIKEEYPNNIEIWNYLAAALYISTRQKEFAMQHHKDFIAYMAEKGYVQPDHRKIWTKNLNTLYEKYKGMF